jgi:hypothetical protein
MNGLLLGNTQLPLPAGLVLAGFSSVCAVEHGRNVRLRTCHHIINQGVWMHTSLGLGWA